MTNRSSSFEKFPAVLDIELRERFINHVLKEDPQCLEPQLANLRAALGFEIVNDCITGDGSVIFQVLTPME